MPVEPRDQHLILEMRQARERIKALEDMHGWSERLSLLAFELIHEGLARFERAVQRQDVEELEADESHAEFVAARTSARAEVEQVLQKLHEVEQGNGRLLRFFEDHPDNRALETVGALMATAREAHALAPSCLPPELAERAQAELTHALETLHHAQADFQREESQFVEAAEELGRAREEAYVSVLNARDLMRAALRSADRLHEIDAILPTLADMLQSR